MTLLLLLSITTESLQAQSNNSDYTNQYDEAGRKHGYWIEEKNDFRWEENYEHGVLHGVYKCYCGGSLWWLGEYDKGEYSGVWYSFESDGRLMGKMFNFRPNDEGIWVLWPNKRYPKNMAYSIGYNKNGSKSYEGFFMFDDGDFEIDVWYYGLIFYYDEDGELKEMRLYGNGKEEIYSLPYPQKNSLRSGKFLPYPWERACRIEQLQEQQGVGE